MSFVTGPKGLPLLGNLLPFMSDPLAFLTGLRQRHGDIVEWRVGPRSAILVSHPDQVGEVLTQVENTYEFPDLGRSFKQLTGEGVATSRGERWRRKRARAMPALRPHRVQAYAEVMVDETVEYLKEWADGARIDVYARISELTRRIAVRAIFGSPPGDAGDGIGAALTVAQAQIGADFRGASALVPDWMITPGRLRLRRAVDTLAAEVTRLVADYRRRPPTEENLLSRLVEARDENGDPLSDREIRDEAITFYVAGHATTAATLTWALILLSRHPKAYAALRDEVGAVLARRLPAHDDFPALHYSQQVVKETLRLYPPSWSLAHIARDGATLAGQPVAPGTLVFTSPWVTQRDSRWFTDAEQFRPERWEGGEHSEYAWFPFGGGPRVCPGARYATVKAVLVLAGLTQRFHLDVDAVHNPPYPGLTAFPSKPVWATVRAAT